MRKIANGEGNSQSTQININHATPLSVLDFSQRKRIYNRTYHQRRKERNIMATQETTQISSMSTNENPNGKSLLLIYLF